MADENPASDPPRGDLGPGASVQYPPPSVPALPPPQPYPGYPSYVVGAQAYPPGAVYVQPATPKTSPAAIIAVVLAVLSFLQCPVVLAVVALVLARSAETDIAASNGWVTGAGLARGARIAAWINIGLSIALGIGLLVLMILAPGMSPSTTTSGV